MSKPANKTLIGIFVVGAIVLVVVAVVVLGSGKFFKHTVKYVMFFEGSVKGLNIGAPVIFRGVKVGSVSEIRMAINPKDLSVLIPVYVEIGGEGQFVGLGEAKGIVEAFRRRQDELARRDLITQLIKRGLRAQLDMQSFVTGQLQIALDFFPDTPAKFVGADPETPEIPTIPTALQTFLKKLEELPLEDIVKDLSSAIKGVNRVVNSPEITQTLRFISQAADETRQLAHDMNSKTGPLLSSLESTVKGTERLAGDVQKLAQNLNDQVQPLSTSAQEALKEAQKLMRGLDEKTTTLTSRIDEALKDAQNLVRNVNGEINPVATSLKSTLASIEKASDEAGATLQQAQQTLKSVEGDVTGESELVYQINQALRDIRALSKAVRDLADTLDRQPESAIFGKKNSTGR
jgi:paraquat-inducible protein B